MTAVRRGTEKILSRDSEQLGCGTQTNAVRALCAAPPINYRIQNLSIHPAR